MLIVCTGPISPILLGFHTACADPIIRQTTVYLPGLPRANSGLKIALISDLHVAGPDMPPHRLSRIVNIVNSVSPDLVLLAGDLVGDYHFGADRYSFDQAAAPLGALQARLGALAVLGNHDQWKGGSSARKALMRQNIATLTNQARAVGPLSIGGLGDATTGHADLPKTLAAMQSIRGPQVLLSHRPEAFLRLPASVPLMLAGHTHCGQIRFPFEAVVARLTGRTSLRFCGILRNGPSTLIVSAGLGTSRVPIRWGTHPDIWLITLLPSAAPVELSHRSAEPTPT